MLTYCVCFLRVLPAEGYCSMYGICAHRSDRKILNCANSTNAVKVKIQPWIGVNLQYNLAGEHYPVSF
jgi:hypothetical protein